MTQPKKPILSGAASSDYENYLRTSELLRLQKGPDEWIHRDELLFTVVHQTSELWLKLMTNEVIEAVQQLRLSNVRESHRLLGRAVLCITQAYSALDVLEKMSPCDYQQVREALGHGSGFDSPGFKQLRQVVPLLEVELNRMLDENKLDLLIVLLNDRLHEDFYQLAEWLIELDERVTLWRLRHFQVVKRTIGFSSHGTQGTPVEFLNRLNSFTFFPTIWNTRNELTKLSETRYNQS